MRAIAVLQKLVRRSIPSIHLKRLTALLVIVGGALRGGRPTLSALAAASIAAARSGIGSSAWIDDQLQQERLLTRSAERIAVLLLIHALAIFLAWIAGRAAQRTGFHQRRKSNADRKYQNFSVVTLGWMALTLIGLHLSEHITTAIQMPPPLAPSLPETQI